MNINIVVIDHFDALFSHSFHARRQFYSSGLEWDENYDFHVFHKYSQGYLTKTFIKCKVPWNRLRRNHENGCLVSLNCFGIRVAERRLLIHPWRYIFLSLFIIEFTLIKQRKHVLLNTAWAPPKPPPRRPRTIWNQENGPTGLLSTSQSSSKQPKRPPLALEKRQGVDERDEIDGIHKTDEMDEIHATDEIDERDEINASDGIVG